MDKVECERLHQKSLFLGKMFRDTYTKFGKHNKVTKRLLLSYIMARRDLPVEIDEEGKLVRYGAADAYEITQGTY